MIGMERGATVIFFLNILLTLMVISNKMDNTNNVNLKKILKSVNSKKILIKNQVSSIQIKQNVTAEELSIVRNEATSLKESIQDLNTKISKVQEQIAVADTLKNRAKSKLEEVTNILNNFIKNFQTLFNSDTSAWELKRAEEEKMLREKQREIDEQNERDLNEAIQIEKECEALENENVELKKRNNELMMELKRQLNDTYEQFQFYYL